MSSLDERVKDEEHRALVMPGPAGPKTDVSSKSHVTNRSNQVWVATVIW